MCNCNPNPVLPPFLSFPFFFFFPFSSFGLSDANLISFFFFFFSNMSSTKWVAVPFTGVPNLEICTYLSRGRSYIVYSILSPPANDSILLGRVAEAQDRQSSKFFGVCQVPIIVSSGVSSEKPQKEHKKIETARYNPLVMWCDRGEFHLSQFPTALNLGMFRNRNRIWASIVNIPQ